MVLLLWTTACVTTDLPALATLAMLVAGIHGSSGDTNVQGEVQKVSSRQAEREQVPGPVRQGERGGLGLWLACGRVEALPVFGL